MKKYYISLLLLSVLFLSACGTNAEPGNQTNTQTEILENQENEPNENLNNVEKAEESLIDNTNIHSWKTESGYVVATLENNNDIDVTIHANITYYDSSESMISSAETYCWDCAANGECVFWFSSPTDSNSNNVDYSSFSITYTVEDAHNNFPYTNCGSQISIESNKSSDGGVVANFTNPTGSTIDSMETVCVYYLNGNAVGFSFNLITDFADTISSEFDAPRDANFEVMNFDDYKIYINSTETYNN